jgi:hypothetical protein
VQKGYEWLGAGSRSALRRLHNAFEANRQMPLILAVFQVILWNTRYFEWAIADLVGAQGMRRC